MSTLLGYVAAFAVPVAWLFFRYEVYEAYGYGAVNPAVTWLGAIGYSIATWYALTINSRPFFLLSVSLALFTWTEFGLQVYMRRLAAGNNTLSQDERAAQQSEDEEE